MECTCFFFTFNNDLTDLLCLLSELIFKKLSMLNTPVWAFVVISACKTSQIYTELEISLVHYYYLILFPIYAFRSV